MRLKFELWDSDTFSDDKLGSVETTLEEVVRSNAGR